MTFIAPLVVLREIIMRWLLFAMAACLPGVAFHLLAADPPAPSNKPVAFKGARIHTVVGPVIERGVLVIDKGKIAAVGAEESVTIPAGTDVLDYAGKTI